MRALFILPLGLTLAACGVGDVPNSAYVPAQEQQLRDAEFAGLPRLRVWTHSPPKMC